MGVRAAFTDDSLFGFDDAAGILANKLIETCLRNVDAVVCASHTGYVALPLLRCSILISIQSRNYGSKIASLSRDGVRGYERRYRGPVQAGFIYTDI